MSIATLLDVGGFAVERNEDESYYLKSIEIKMKLTFRFWRRLGRRWWSLLLLLSLLSLRHCQLIRVEQWAELHLSC